MNPAVFYVRTELQQMANPVKAQGMSRYMYGRRWQEVCPGKTEMPFYGVQKPGRTRILGDLVRDFPPANRDGYEEMVLALWDLPHREEKYLALGYARHFEQHVVPQSLPLYRRLISDGAWWDLVDDVATHLIRALVLGHPEEVWPVVETWIDDDDMWLRRTAIICQVGAKDRTDADRLFAFCRARVEEKEFFIRKAIGWALREYSKTNPEAVAGLVRELGERMSGLSYREATKYLGDLV